MDASACADALRRGHGARQTGDVARAIACFREAVVADPGSAQAHGALGLMLLRAGELDASSAPLRQAVALDPSQPAHRMNLAELFARHGELPAALELVLAITREHPAAWWAWERLGELQAALREFEQARTAFARALDLRPDDPALLYKLARAESDCGDPDAAQALVNKAALRAPGHEAVLGLQAELLAARADWQGLGVHARRWLDHKRAEGVALRWLARAEWEQGFLRDALANLQQALHVGPRDVDGLATLARLALLAQEVERADAAVEEACSLEPDAPELFAVRAILAMYRGHHSDAEDFARRALEHDPRDVTAWKTRVQLCGGHMEAAALAALQDLECSLPPDARDRADVGFALGDCLDAAGRHAEAFDAWSRANVLQAQLAAREGFGYDAAAREREVDALIGRFAVSRPESAMPVASPRLVFIVGMPRSGTTLLESVLGVHPEVLACGERAAMRGIMAECMALGREPGEQELARWRREYLADIRVSPGVQVLVDKNPWNFDAVGLIARLFPDARILHLVRDAGETAFSIFRNAFPKFVTFARRFEDIAHYRAQYERVMRHWDSVLPGKVLSLRYEDLVSDFGRVAPQAVAHCGLAWDERCRDFARPGRVVATLSTVQVRQPLASARSRAAHYREFTS